TVRVSDGSLTDSRSFTITICLGCERAPTLAPVSDMTLTEGTTADQVLTGSDPDGDPLIFSKVRGPLFMTVTTTCATTGNIHLAPGFADAGIYAATVSASDGTLSDQRSFSITCLTSGNRCPTANPGGPYSGLVGV